MRPGGNVDCIYAESGSYKTTNVGFFATYIYETYGLPTRLVTADLGGARNIQHLVDAGIIQAFHLPMVKNPIATMDAVCKGKWPVYNSKLKTFELKDLEIDGVIGGYAFEGLTSMSDLIFAQLRKTGPQLGEQPSYKFTEGEFSTHGGNKSYYGFLQNRMFDLIAATNALPVRRVLWTAHEGEFEEDGKTSYGPGIAGRKAGPKVPSWVGGCYHFYQVKKKSEEKVAGATNPNVREELVEVRGYFRAHPDLYSNGIYKAKPRVPAHLIPRLMATYPGGYFPLAIDKGFDAFLKVEAELLSSAGNEMTDWRKKVDEKFGKGETPAVSGASKG